MKIVKNRTKKLVGVCLGLLVVFAKLEARADYPYWEEYQPPRYSSHQSGQQGMVSLDLDPQKILNNSFRIAVRENRFIDLQKFLRQGADVNSRADGGETSLMFAARNCSAATANLLIHSGAEINARDFDGRTALIFAAMSSCVKVVTIILRSPGVELDVKDNENKTAFDYAGESSLLEVGGPDEQIMHLIRVARRTDHKTPRQTHQIQGPRYQN